MYTRILYAWVLLASASFAEEVDPPDSFQALSGVGDPMFPDLGNAGYDALSYLLRLRVDPIESHIEATCTMTAVATARLPRFHLDLSGLEVDRVALDGAPVGFERRDRELIVETPRPIEAGAEFEVEVAYHGEPRPILSRAVPFASGIGWLQFGDEVFVLSEPEGARSWFPCNDHPTDKARFEMFVTVPDDFTAAANGKRVSLDEGDGERTYHFRAATPMATYLATVAIGDFELVESATEGGLPLYHYFPTGTAEDYEDRVAFTAEVIPWLEERFGPYPFESYGAVVAEVGILGALETQTLPIYGWMAFRDDVIAHELAHQWFGNSVSVARWQDIWLAEGFAQFAMWLMVERRGGRDAYDQTVAAQHGLVAARKVGPPATPPVEELFGGAVYVRGGLVLNALRVELGDEEFFALLRGWTARYRDKNASTEDFIAFASEAADRDLSELLRAWLYDEAVPDLP